MARLAVRVRAEVLARNATPYTRRVEEFRHGPSIHSDSMSPSRFHPAVQAWFAATFPNRDAGAADAWPAIASGRHALIAAPTGSGKTLAAFLAAIDSLVREGVGGPAART